MPDFPVFSEDLLTKIIISELLSDILFSIGNYPLKDKRSTLYLLC